ncbi:serine O-acetyltransferase [Sphingomonas gellani]|uniref:Serine O-acetyltransferase n=1 Tax=Sphingomonas gellani TaxID=1166340 RepID=A0A1H8B400_9SPHN|nr:serine acetyltransferase [Sphingomonas gellani]SEM77466.1 serine O-acetyltransferase [Sphingomonas gellani]
MIAADVHRQFGRFGWARAAKLYLRDPGFRPIVTLRLYHGTRDTRPGRLIRPLLWLCHRQASRQAGRDLPIRTQVRPGLLIAHSIGIVVNAAVRIGRNVTLFHGVTLGRGDRIHPDGTRTSGFPVIGDDVFLGPHAVVAGDVRIGAGSRILAGAVVVKDVPPRSVVAGNPATIIRTDCEPDVGNRVPFDDADGDACNQPA